MKTKYCIAVLLVLAFCLTIPAKEKPIITDKIKQEVKDRIKKGKTIGIVIGIIHPDGTREVYASGRADQLKKIPVSRESMFEIGSITKTFTAILFSKMVQEGKLDPDARPEKYLPRGVTLPDYNGKKISLWHLSSHVSGLPRLPGNFKPADIRNPYIDYSVQMMYKGLKTISLKSEPGSTYLYSNLGTALLGNILEIQSKLPYEELVKQTICRPLAMIHTTITLTDAQKQIMCTGHNIFGATPLWDFNGMAGAGALRSNVDDMLTYLGANLGIISSDLLSAMEATHQVRKKTGGNGRYELDVGLAWHILRYKSSMVYIHNGGTGGFRSFIGFRRDIRTGVVVLSNKNLSMDDLGLHLLDPHLPLEK